MSYAMSYAMSLSMLARPTRSTGRPTDRPRARPRRRRASPLFAAALVALAAAGPIAPTAQAQVRDGVDYVRCVDAVVEWTDGCYDRNGILGDIACTIVGVAGILACAAAEAVEKIGGGVRLG